MATRESLEYEPPGKGTGKREGMKGKLNTNYLIRALSRY